MNELFKKAAQARDNKDYKTAMAYYTQLILEEPREWEGLYYSAYCMLKQTTIRRMVEDCENMSRNFFAVTDKIRRSDKTEEEKLAAVTEMASATLELSDSLYYETVRYESQLDPSHWTEEEAERQNRRIRALAAMNLNLGDLIEKQFGGSPDYAQIISAAREQGITELYEYPALREETDPAMFTVYADRIRKYYPDYVFSGEKPVAEAEEAGAAGSEAVREAEAGAQEMPENENAEAADETPASAAEGEATAETGTEETAVPALEIAEEAAQGEPLDGEAADAQTPGTAEVPENKTAASENETEEVQADAQTDKEALNAEEMAAIVSGEHIALEELLLDDVREKRLAEQAAREALEEEIQAREEAAAAERALEKQQEEERLRERRQRVNEYAAVTAPVLNDIEPVEEEAPIVPESYIFIPDVEELSAAKEVKAEEPPAAEKAGMEEASAPEEAKAEEVPVPEEAKAEESPVQEEIKEEESPAAEEAKPEEASVPEEAKAEEPPVAEEAKPEEASAPEETKAEETPAEEEARSEIAAAKSETKAGEMPALKEPKEKAEPAVSAAKAEAAQKAAEPAKPDETLSAAEKKDRRLSRIILLAALLLLLIIGLLSCGLIRRNHEAGKASAGQTTEAVSSGEEQTAGSSEAAAPTQETTTEGTAAAESTAESTSEATGTEESTTEEAITEEATTGELTTEEVTTEELTTEEATTEEATTEEPTTEEPTTEEPTTEEPTTEEPATEEPTTEEPTTEEPTTEAVKLPAVLPSSENVKQYILVETNGSDARLTLYDKTADGWDAAAEMNGKGGKNGIAEKKVRGDGCTPAGEFAIAFVFGPETAETGLESKKLTASSVWVTDPDSAYYNTLQDADSSSWSKSVNLFETYFNSGNYTQFIYFAHNGDGLTAGGKDSAAGADISIRGVKGSRQATSGDLDISAEDMETLLGWLESAKNPVIIITRAK